MFIIFNCIFILVIKLNKPLNFSFWHPFGGFNSALPSPDHFFLNISLSIQIENNPRFEHDRRSSLHKSDTINWQTAWIWITVLYASHWHCFKIPRKKSKHSAVAHCRRKVLCFRWLNCNNQHQSSLYTSNHCMVFEIIIQVHVVMLSKRGEMCFCSAALDLAVITFAEEKKKNGWGRVEKDQHMFCVALVFFLFRSTVLACCQLQRSWFG